MSFEAQLSAVPTPRRCAHRRVAMSACVLVLASTSCVASPSDDQPRVGGVFRMGVANLQTLDPSEARSVEEVLVTDQLFDSLTSLDPQTLLPAPSIASSWSANPEQTVFDFTIRPDATFTSGRPVTALDVKYSLDRVSRQGSTSPLGELLEPVVGFIAWHVDGLGGGVSGISAPAPNVVRISLDRPWSELPTVLASPGFGVVPREAVESTSAPFAEQPVGSGPFEFVDRVDAGIVRLRPREGVPAYVQEINLVPFDNVQASYEAFLNDDLEWSRVPPEKLVDDGGTEGTVVSTPYLAVLYYGLNLANPALADPRFREAIVRSIDREAIRREVFGETVDVIDGVAPRGIPGSQDDPCQGRCTFNVEAAKQLVDSAYTLKDPPGVPVMFEDDPQQQAVADRIVEGLLSAGVPAVASPVAPEQYAEVVRSGQPALFRLGWVANYASADAYLAPLFVTGAPANFVAFSDPNVDALVAQARASADPAVRASAYQQAERIVMSEFAVIPIAQFRIFGVLSDRVRGFEMETSGTFDASKVWLTSG